MPKDTIEATIWLSEPRKTHSSHRSKSEKVTDMVIHTADLLFSVTHSSHKNLMLRPARQHSL